MKIKNLHELSEEMKNMRNPSLVLESSHFHNILSRQAAHVYICPTKAVKAETISSLFSPEIVTRSFIERLYYYSDELKVLRRIAVADCVVGST